MQEVYLESAEIISRAWPDWEIRDTIGTGAFATVYRASRRERIAGEKDSAIKVIRIPHDDTDWDRMLAEGKTREQAEAFFQSVVDDSLKEIRAMEELSGHTNIVNIFDYKRYHVPDKHVWYILIRMELLQKVDTGKLDEKEIIRLGMDVCTALSICRKKNIVHRDVSLDNIFIHDGCYKLGDFGVAKVLEGTLGGLQSIAGKPLYMAPEIYNATLTETDMDSAARVDIYSLGILLYRLTHHMNYPFENPDTPNIPASERSAAFRRRVIEGEELPPPKYASPELAEIILKASMANPARRYENADDMRADLQALAEPLSVNPPRRIRMWLNIAIAAVAVLVFAAGVWLLVRRPESEPETKNDTAEVPVITEPIGLDSDTIQVVLTAPENTNAGDFNRTVAMLHERLAIFTEGFSITGETDGTGNPEPYQLVFHDSQIELLLPRAAFSGRDCHAVLERYLVLPIQMCIHDNNTGTRYYLAPSQYIELAPDNLTAAVRNGTIDGINPADYGIDADRYPYVEVVFSDEFLDNSGETTNAWNSLAFASDPHYRIYRALAKCVFDTIPSGDGKTWYIVDHDDPDGRFTRLIHYNLAHNPLPVTLDFRIDLNDQTAWQYLETASHPGEYQCNYSDIGDESVTYRLYTTSASEGKKLDTENVLKKRLDASGVPYAFGITDQGTKTWFTVKTQASHTGIQLMYALGSVYFTIRNGLTYDTIEMKSFILKPDEDSPGFSLIPDKIASLYDDNLKSIQLFAAKATENDGFLYVCPGTSTIPAFAVRADTVTEDGRLDIQYLCEIRDSGIITRQLEPDHTEIQQFMEGLIQNPDTPAMLWTDMEWQVNTKFGDSVPAVPDFALKYDQGIEEMQEKIQKICRTAVVTAKNNLLSVELNLPPNDLLPDKALPYVREIYESLDFAGTYYTSLAIILNSKADQNPITFEFSKKTRKITDDPNDGYIYLMISMLYDLDESYSNSLLDAVNHSEFLAPFSRTESVMHFGSY